MLIRRQCCYQWVLAGFWIPQVSAYLAGYTLSVATSDDVCVSWACSHCCTSCVREVMTPAPLPPFGRVFICNPLHGLIGLLCHPRQFRCGLVVFARLGGPAAHGHRICRSSRSPKGSV
ncbi:hypothetical protein PR003_g24859 [Phytophthora rubi]|uniref:Secreted protein n=1 Tax=Phytophthora rubi TaxID=129364 RepID=A0A6A3JML3_9STRA|nr:hypothetical protein PR002_g22915 [Phytophthora rubi]KAE8995272.1 hypothetical protein PR001_g20167 [Phytophthora rubi]KAE9292069.1 hypothetical protein PR003_g24859 [Phytophthora rubi]